MQKIERKKGWKDFNTGSGKQGSHPRCEIFITSIGFPLESKQFEFKLEKKFKLISFLVVL